jgi:hypothetical protein
MRRSGLSGNGLSGTGLSGNGLSGNGLSGNGLSGNRVGWKGDHLVRRKVVLLPADHKRACWQVLARRRRFRHLRPNLLKRTSQPLTRGGARVRTPQPACAQLRPAGCSGPCCMPNGRWPETAIRGRLYGRSRAQPGANDALRCQQTYSAGRPPKRAGGLTWLSNTKYADVTKFAFHAPLRHTHIDPACAARHGIGIGIDSCFWGSAAAAACVR